VLTQNIFTVGTAAQTVVAPTNDVATYVLKNLQPRDVDDSARDGFIYLLSRDFTVNQASSVAFSLLTGSTGAQLDFYEIVSDNMKIYAELIEGATITTTGDPIPAYNLNRNKSDAHTSVFTAASAVTGGTVISTELVTAAKDAGGALSSVKIHTLKPSTEYAMRFTNQGNQNTTVHFQLGFSEQYNGYSDIWLSTIEDSYVLRSGEEIKFTLLPEEIINATALAPSKLAVMRSE
jgi:hypothetical protein